jgi:LmbE family N-acetylglucosaminyl deacetylase
VVEAAQMARVTWDIHFFEPTIGTASRVGFVPDHYVDISDVFEQKVEALKKLAGQPKLVPDYTLCNRWRGIECGRQYAEAFKRWAPTPLVHELLAPVNLF